MIRRSHQELRMNLRRGSTMVLMAILIPVTLAVASYAVNLAYMELSRTELQIASDSAVRAAGRVYNVSGSREHAVAAAARMLSLNRVGEKTITIDDTKLEFGVSTRLSEWERYQFASGNDPNSVRIAAGEN
ncbi:MAG: Tad domain-containing protein [Pirellulales bacterium]